MRFRKISSQEPVADYLVEVLERESDKGRRVLWLVPGGSSIAAAAAVSKRLTPSRLKSLTVTLTDERYGPVGHPDSNWRQLEEAGFSLPDAKSLPVLTGQNMADTVTYFANLLQKLLNENDFVLGFFGIGADGHTAGILPGSPAVHETAFAAGYDAGNFKRITMTPAAIARLDEAVVYAAGEAKWPVLDQLEADIPLEDQPAQALKQVRKVTIFDDYK